MPARPKLIRVRLVGTKTRPDIDSHQRLIQFGFVLEPSTTTGLPNGIPSKLDEQIWPGMAAGSFKVPPKDVYAWTYRLYVKKFVLDGKEEIHKSGSDTAASECPSSGAQTAINVFEDSLHDQMKAIEAIRSMMEESCMKIIYIEIADATVPGSPEKALSEVIYDPFNTEQPAPAPKAEGGRRRRHKRRRTQRLSHKRAGKFSRRR
jgi:hypothetical protein